MNTRTVLVFAAIGLLLISSLDAAKPAKGKKEVKAEKADKNADPAMGEVVVLEESQVLGEAPTPKIYRPKNLKVITAYDKCKMDCQKIRDQEGLAAYASQLREELAAAEAALELEAAQADQLAEPATAA